MICIFECFYMMIIFYTRPGRSSWRCWWTRRGRSWTGRCPPGSSKQTGWCRSAECSPGRCPPASASWACSARSRCRTWKWRSTAPPCCSPLGYLSSNLRIKAVFNKFTADTSRKGREHKSRTVIGMWKKILNTLARKSQVQWALNCYTDGKISDK